MCSPYSQMLFCPVFSEVLFFPASPSLLVLSFWLLLFSDISAQYMSPRAPSHLSGTDHVSYSQLGFRFLCPLLHSQDLFSIDGNPASNQHATQTTFFFKGKIDYEIRMFLLIMGTNSNYSNSSHRMQAITTFLNVKFKCPTGLPLGEIL